MEFIKKKKQKCLDERDFDEFCDIKCDNKFCIHNIKSGVCAFSHIEVDCLGRCESMELIKINDELYEYIKNNSIIDWCKSEEFEV